MPLPLSGYRSTVLRTVLASVVDPHWFQCGQGYADFYSMRIRIRVQGDKSIRIPADPDQIMPSQKAEFLHEKYTLCR
jgi:hypothetical protein